MSNPKDVNHSFPESVDGFANEFGRKGIAKGRDGKKYKKLELEGNYNKRDGKFEYIKDNNGNINHRYFNTE